MVRKLTTNYRKSLDTKSRRERLLETTYHLPSCLRAFALTLYLCVVRGGELSRGELPRHLIDVAQRQCAHLPGREIADGVRQLDQGMSIHSPAAESMHCCILENLREKHRRRYAAFLELHRVVHTAQRARAS